MKNQRGNKEKKYIKLKWNKICRFIEKMEYELPDGTMLNFKEERFVFGECLFNGISKKDSKVTSIGNFIKHIIKKRILTDIALKEYTIWSLIQSIALI